MQQVFPHALVLDLQHVEWLGVRPVVHALILVWDELVGQQATKACSQQQGM